MRPPVGSSSDEINRLQDNRVYGWIGQEKEFLCSWRVGAQWPGGARGGLPGALGGP